MTLDERLEALAHSLELQVSLQAESGKRLDEKMAELTHSGKRLDERIEAVTQSLELQISLHADSGKRLDERIGALTQSLELQISLQADISERHDEAIARHDREMAEIRRELGRAVRLSLQEARHERRQRQDLAKRQQEMADAADKRHQELEALLKAFLERSGNGRH
jgi:hypothetical protein